MKRPSQRGFTLVELMITTVIIGVLSTVAIPSFQRFIRKARTAEAPTNLAAMSHGILNYYNRERLNAQGLVERPHFPRCAGNALCVAFTTMPAANPCSATAGVSVAGSPKYLRDPNRWSVAPWVDMNFAIPDAHYYRYSYQVPTAETCANPGCYFYWVRAEADMDCDGVRSEIRQRGERDQTTGEILRSGVIKFSDPEE